MDTFLVMLFFIFSNCNIITNVMKSNKISCLIMNKYTLNDIMTISIKMKVSKY